MLIITVGESGTGKTHFIEQRMGEIKGYDTKRKVKIFSAFQNEIPPNDFLNLICNHRHMSADRQIDFDDMVIETCSLRHLTPDVINNAHYIIFTTYDGMQRYFIDSQYGVHSSSIFKTMKQVNKFFTERYPACIWDNWNKLFI